MKENLVSIICPVYNSEQYLKDMLNSVQNQTYENWELLLIDDASDDASVEIIHAYAQDDSRIQLIRLEKNQGAAVARNKGMELAKGKYIAYIDSDDMWYPQKLERQLQFMKEHDYAFTTTAYEYTDEHGNPTGKRFRVKKKTGYWGLLLNFPVLTITNMFDVEKLGKFYIEPIRKRNDLILFLKILEKSPAYGLNEVLSQYRQRPNSLSRNKLDLIKYNWYVYRNIAGRSVVTSAFLIGLIGVIKLLRIK